MISRSAESQLRALKRKSLSLSFTKWRGRNFVGFVEFPSFPLEYIWKKFPYGSEVICFCLCVWVSPQNSAIFFDPLDGPTQNVKGPLTSLQVIFGRVTGTLRPSGSGPYPEKEGFCQIYLLWGFWGRGGCVAPFRNQDNEANKMFGAEFWFLSRKAGQAGHSYQKVIFLRKNGNNLIIKILILLSLNRKLKI